MLPKWSLVRGFGLLIVLQMTSCASQLPNTDQAIGDPADPKARLEKAILVAHDPRAILGIPTGLTVVALDQDGFVDENAAGTLYLSCSEPILGLPNTVHFAPENKGVVVLSHLIFTELGRVRVCASHDRSGQKPLASRELTIVPDLAGSPMPEQVKDVNADRKINEDDKLLIEQAMAAKTRLIAPQYLAGDINGDGRLTKADLDLFDKPLSSDESTGDTQVSSVPRYAVEVKLSAFVGGVEVRDNDVGIFPLR